MEAAFGCLVDDHRLSIGRICYEYLITREDVDSNARVLQVKPSFPFWRCLVLRLCRIGVFCVVHTVHQTELGLRVAPHFL